MVEVKRVTNPTGCPKAKSGVVVEVRRATNHTGCPKGRSRVVMEVRRATNPTQGREKVHMVEVIKVQCKKVRKKGYLRTIFGRVNGAKKCLFILSRKLNSLL